jgi:hypothetical protein
MTPNPTQIAEWTPNVVDWISRPPPEPWTKMRPLSETVHFCNTCDKEFATCASNPKFGNGKGLDNVISCDSYLQKEVGKKCYACGFAGEENKFKHFCAACHKGI